MLEKVQSKLRELGVNLSKERTAEWSKVLSTNLTEESTDEEIQNTIKLFEGIIKEQAKADDKVRSLEAELKKPKEEPTPPNPPKDEPKDDIKELLESLKGEIQSLKVEKTQETLKDKFLKDEALSKIPQSLLNELAPKTAEDYDSAVQKARGIAIELNKSLLIDSTPPAGSGGDVKEASADEIARVSKLLK